jgi:anti-anti-sigma factor
MAAPAITRTTDERRITVRIDAATMDAVACDELTAAVHEELANKPRDVVIDCTRLKFLPSLAIGALINLRREVCQSMHELILAGLCDHIHKALLLSHLDRVFPMIDSVPSPAPASPAL